MEHRVREAVSNAVKGSDRAPLAGVLLECVVVMGWMDDEGEHATTYILCGSPWATSGLAKYAIAQMDINHELTVKANYEGGDDE